MVKSEKVYSPQDYLKLITGEYYAVRGHNDIETIACVLEKNGYSFCSCPMRDIERIVAEDVSVVLVNCKVFDDKAWDYKHVYMWYEVPQNFEDEQ